MASQKEVKNRIASIKNINKITRAMEMVAAARLRRAEQRIEALRPYAQSMRKLTRRAAEQAGGIPRVPVLEERAEEKRVGVVLVTGDRGLAGAFNSNIIRDGLRLKGELDERGSEAVFSAVGRKGVGALTFRKLEPRTSYVGFTDRPAFANAREIGEGAADEEEDSEETEIEKAHSRSLWVYEPEAEELLAQLIPEYVNISIYRALLESAASELGARMTAMRSAAENAEEMMGDLTLEMNRARQAEITQEILEVVGGAEALG